MFEPTLNLAKGLLIGIASLFALVSAVDAIIGDGRTIAAGIAAAPY